MQGVWGFSGCSVVKNIEIRNKELGIINKEARKYKM